MLHNHYDISMRIKHEKPSIISIRRFKRERERESTKKKKTKKNKIINSEKLNFKNWINF